MARIFAPLSDPNAADAATGAEDEVSPGAAPSIADFDRLGNLFIAARTLVEGLYHGRHAASVRGGSTEFFDYRMYAPGDEIARLDWKLFGRTDRLYVRRFRRFAELTAHPIVDASASMGFAGLEAGRGSAARVAPFSWFRRDTRVGSEFAADSAARPRIAETKYRYASLLAAAVAFLAVRQGDRAALSIVADRTRAAFPSGGTWTHLHRIFHALERVRPEGATALPACLAEAHRPIRRPQWVVVCSDFLSNPREIFDALHRFKHDRCDVTAVQVLTRDEIDLAGAAGEEGVEFVDPEDRSNAVRTSIPTIREDYARVFGEHLRTLRIGLTARGIDYRLVRTDASPIEALRALVRGARAR